VAARGKIRQFPTAFKLKAIKRAEGEGVLPVARKLGISRKLLHDWIKAWKAHGPEGLSRKRGPKPGPRRLKPLGANDGKRSALAEANARIAELELLVGRQQLDIVFFAKPCAPWSGRQRKAKSRPHHRSHDAGGNRIARRCTAPMQARGPRACRVLRFTGT
jgi:transposase